MAAPGRAAPVRWPSAWQWLAAARANGLGIIPAEAFNQLRVDHSLLGRRLTILSHPAAISHVCGKGNANYRLSNLHLRLLKPALGSGLTVAEGRNWTVQRRLAARLMPARHARERLDQLQERIGAWIDGQSANAGDSRLLGAQELGDGLTGLSIDLLSQAVFDYDRPVATPRIVEAVNEHRLIIEKPDFLDIAGVNPAWRSARMRRAATVAHALDDQIERTIDDATQGHRRGPPGTGARVGEPSRPNDFNRDFVVSLISGFESITATLTWMLLLCAFDQPLQERLRAALKADDFLRVVPDRSAAPTLLDAFLRETLRLYPPLPFMFRVALRDDETPCGLLRAGTLVCISPWVVHRHHTLWERPDQFDVTRHDHTDAESPAYMPFGVGARRCIGMHVGNHLVKLTFARVLEAFEVASPDAHMPAPHAGLSLRPQPGFRLRLTRRG